MSVQAVIPVKRLDRALGRLAAVLSPRERRTLQEAMLRDLLGACRGCDALAETLVVTADPDAAALAADLGARVLPDHTPPRGMNAAVAIGLADAVRGRRLALVLTADLPLATAEDLTRVVAAAPGGRGIVLVPSRDGTGTNALLMVPADAMPTELGPDSRGHHRAHAAAQGLEVVEVMLPRLALDIDTPADLALLVTGPHPCEAREACARIGVTEQLVVGTTR
jgi:2-phospho-L-lactate guanylyltransferase